MLIILVWFNSTYILNMSIFLYIKNDDIKVCMCKFYSTLPFNRYTKVPWIINHFLCQNNCRCCHNLIVVTIYKCRRLLLKSKVAILKFSNVNVKTINCPQIEQNMSWWIILKYWSNNQTIVLNKIFKKSHEIKKEVS